VIKIGAVIPAAAKNDLLGKSRKILFACNLLIRVQTWEEQKPVLPVVSLLWSGVH